MRVMTIGLTAVVAVTVALPLLPAFTPRAALASGVVGTGTPGSCTEGALDTALAGGGTVTFNCGGAATITVTSTKTISADTTINGGGVITISGGNSVGVFSVNTGVKFTVHNLTIANGSAGGGIWNLGGTLTVTNSTFYGNTAGSIYGGGISSWGTLTVTNSTFYWNSGGDGGGIYSGGPLTITNSTFSGNSASYGGGGGIYSVGTLTVTNSTFSGNSGGYYGGGIYNGVETLTVTSSTFTGNGAGGGGGIFNNGTLTVTNSTFSSNSASGVYGGGGGGGIMNARTLTVTNSTFTGNGATYGGGIFNDGTLTVTNTILANSTSGGNCAVYAGSVTTDGGHNIDDGTTCGFTGTGCTSTTGTSFCKTNPVLDPAGLQNNGGPTQTIALEAGSPAINAGDEAVCAASPVNNLDQRGFVRPGTGATKCSIGTFEFNSPGPGPPAIPTLSTWGIIGFSSLAFAFVLWAAGRSRWRSPGT